MSPVILSFLTVYICLYFSVYALNAYREKKIISLSLLSFITLYQLFATFCCIQYYILADGLIRDYSNITLLPFLYLFVGFLIAIVPFFLFERKERVLVISQKQINIVDAVSGIIAFCGILPFIETIIHLPSVLSSSDDLVRLYEQQLLTGEKENYMSFIGRKFYYMLDIFDYFIPALLFIQIWKKNINKKLVVGLAICILTIWLRSMAMAGRSVMVGNALYVFGVFLVFRRFISIQKRRMVYKYGIIGLSILLLALFVVTISRYRYNDSSNFESVFQWMSLYAGEGPLNFNNDLWYTNKSTDGYCTLPLWKSLQEGHLITAPEVWMSKERIGVIGNHYYTWIGMLYADWGRYGAMVIIFLLSALFSLPFKKTSFTIGVCPIILLGLWVKVLLMGPMFFGLGGSSQQIYLLILLLFCYILYSNK